MADRLDMLRELLADDPGDPFTRYGLAMELASRDLLDDALVEFQTLVTTTPEYVATYYHYARALQRKGRQEDALAMARRGVEVAGSQGDEHTEGELEDLVAELE
jgi:tetratricopeptide (TPR) repeat protein